MVAHKKWTISCYCLQDAYHAHTENFYNISKVTKTVIKMLFNTSTVCCNNWSQSFLKLSIKYVRYRRHRRFWHATLRLRSAICRHHPPQRAVLSQICCFRERKVVLPQTPSDGAEPRDAGTTRLPPQSAGGEANRIPRHPRCRPCAQYAQTGQAGTTGPQQRAWVAPLASVHHCSAQIGTTWRQAAHADTTGRAHRPYMRLS